MRIPVSLLMSSLPSVLMAYSPPREHGIYLETSFGAGSFLYDIGESKPKFSRFGELEAGIHGMTASKSAGGVRYGGGFSLSLESIDQKDCGPTECPDAKYEWEKNYSQVLSPFLRFEGPSAGFMVGARFSNCGYVLPRLGLRLGPADHVYGSFEFLNGQSILAEGLLKFGLGGKIRNTEVWMGGDLFPSLSMGIGARVARIFGPVRLVLGGRIGAGEVHYTDTYGDATSIDAEQPEFAGTLGLEFRLPD